jgi:hypothetical protein
MSNNVDAEGHQFLKKMLPSHVAEQNSVPWVMQ